MIKSYLIASWILGHILNISGFFLRKKGGIFLIYSSILFFLFIYFNKDSTYDLIAYTKYFTQPYPMELGFYYLTKFFIKIGFTSNEILITFQLLILTLLLYSFYILNSKLELLTIPTLIGSIFFLIATQNILRQGLAISLYFLGFAFYFRTRKINLKSLILFFSSLLFHYWTFVIIALTFFYFSFSRLKNLNSAFHFFYYGILFGFLALLNLTILDFSEDYLIGNPNWIANRTPAHSKIIIYYFIFIITNLILSKYKIKDKILKDIYKIRYLIFAFSSPFVIYSEIYSRIFVYYFFWEMIFLIFIIKSNRYNSNYILLVAGLSYTFAPNAWNIIAGH